MSGEICRPPLIPSVEQPAVPYGLTVTTRIPPLVVVRKPVMAAAQVLSDLARDREDR